MIMDVEEFLFGKKHWFSDFDMVDEFGLFQCIHHESCSLCILRVTRVVMVIKGL